MFTPQEIQEISFEKAVFRGYDMDSVDEVLEPLTEDYITLYKENSVLKSKMRILVEKLEEYRRQETSMQNALLAAQKTCDQLVAEAEKKCAKMLRDAEETVAAKNRNVDGLVAEEQSRLEAAQTATAEFIGDMESFLKQQLAQLEEIRTKKLPKDLPTPAKKDGAFDYDKFPSEPTTEEKADAMIEEIEQSMAKEADLPPKLEIHTFHETPKKFEDLQFGPGYDPTAKHED